MVFHDTDTSNEMSPFQKGYEQIKNLGLIKYQLHITKNKVTFKFLSLYYIIPDLEDFFQCL